MHTKQSTISGNYRKLKRKQFWLLETHGKWNTILRMAQTRTIQKKAPHIHKMASGASCNNLFFRSFKIYPKLQNIYHLCTPNSIIFSSLFLILIIIFSFSISVSQWLTGSCFRSSAVQAAETFGIGTRRRFGYCHWNWNDKTHTHIHTPTHIFAVKQIVF